MALTEVNFDQLILDKFTKVVGLDPTTMELDFMFRVIQDGNIENTEEKSYITGAGGVNIAALKRNKAATMTFNNAHLVMSAIGVQTGSGVAVASASNKFNVPVIDIKKVDSATAATLSATPTAISLKFIYKATKDGQKGEKFAAAADATATEFSVTGSTITLPTGKFEVGDTFIAIYETEKTVGKKLSNKSDVVSKDQYIIAEALCRDVCNNNTVYLTKIVMPRASVSGNFTIGAGDTPSPHAFSAETMPDFCSDNGSMWDWFVVDAA